MKTIVNAILILWFVCSVSFSFGQCTANAGASVEICAGDSVVLGGSPTGTGEDELSYSWTNGADPVANPVVFPTVTTNYEVTVTDANECMATDNMTVTVLPAPEVSIEFSQPDDCSTTAVQFLSNVSDCDNCSYAWNFGNDASGPANTSSAPNPNHIFVSTGTGEETFTVSLTVTSANGCSTTTTTEIVGQQSPEAELTEEADFTQCLGIADFYTSVTDASTPAANANYHIDWGDGTPPYNSSVPPSNLQHIYTGLNIWILTYTVTGTNGCTDVKTYEVSNITNPAIGAATLGNTQQCGPVEMCFELNGFSNNHASTTYTVNFGDGSPNETFNHPPPDQVCHTYTTSSCPDSYTFSIQANNNCSPSTVTISPIQIFTPPQADFDNPPEACVNSTVYFQNLSWGGFNMSCSESANFLWDFGDPSSGASNTSTAEDGQHVYTQPGTYTVTLTASNSGNPQLSCGSTTYQQTICVEPPPEPVFSIPTAGCYPFTANVLNTSVVSDQCDLTTYWEVYYDDAPCAPNSGGFQYSGGTGQGSDEPQFSLQSAGEYTIELNLQNSCGTFSESETVTVNTIPTVEINPIENICPEEAILPTAVVDGCNTPISNYSWNFPGGTPASSNAANPGLISYNTAGTYTIQLTITNDCGTATTTETFTVEDPAEINITASEEVICFGQSVELTASGADSYVWESAPGLTSNGANATASPVVTTTYTVTGFTSAGCSASTDITITVNPLPVVNIPVPEAICSGESVVLSPVVNGGSAPYTSFQWTPADGLSQTNIQNPIASPLTSTEYTLVVTDSEGCEETASVTVTVDPLPIVEAGPDITLCNQPVPEQLTGFSPTTGGTGVWSGTGITNAATGEFTPSGVGTYTLTYTFTSASTGCVNSDELTVSVIEPQIVDAGPDLAMCQNSPQIQLEAGTPGGVWSGEDVTPGGIFSPETVQTYTLTYSLGGGSCLTSDEVEIVVHPLPVVDAGSDMAICAGESVDLDGSVEGGTAPYSTIIWNPGDFLSATDVLNPLATPPTTQTYTLTISDANNCASSDEVSIDINPLPEVDAGEDITLCDQLIPVLLEGYSPAGGTWSGDGITNSNTGEFTPDGEGTFPVIYEYTDGNGCTSSDEIIITVTGLTQADAGVDLEMCLNSDAVQLAEEGSWSGNHVSPDGLFTPEESGTFTLTYTTGTGTCETFDDVEITVWELPVVDAGSDQVICFADTLEVLGTGSSSNPPITSMFWSGDLLEDDGTGGMTVSPEVLSTYTLTVTDSEGCIASDEMTVSVNPLPEVDAGEDITLCDQLIPVLLEGYSPAGGTWSGDGITNSNTGEFTPDGEGTFPVIYEYTDGNGCTSNDEIIITVTGLTQADAGVDMGMCLNSDAVQLAEEGSWSGNHVSPDGLFTPEESGTFTLTYTTGTGTCETFDDVEITVWELPVVDAGSDQVICFADTLEVLGTGSSSNPPITSMFWSGDLLEDDGTGGMTVSPDITSTYTLTVTDSENCSASDEMTVSVNELPVIDAGPDVVLCNQPIAFNFEAANPPGGEWTGNGITNSAEGEFTPNGEGNYLVTYTFSNANGCTNSDSLLVQVEEPVIVDAGADVTLCLNEPLYSLTGFVPSTGGNWSGNGIADGSTGIFDAGMAGVGEHVLTLQNGAGTCYSEDQILVTVLGLPVIDPGIDEAFCGNDGVVQLSTFTPMGGTWLGAGIIDASQGTFDTGIGSGSYDLYYGYTDPVTGCADTIVKTVDVSPLPVPDFWVNPEACTDSPLEVDNTTPGTNSYLWDFGNGDTSTDIDPDYTYPTPGNYTITLTATNEFGCIEEISYSAEAIHPPVADFILPITEGCAPLEVLFENTSQGDYLEYLWDFNTGTSNEYEPEPVIYQQGDSTLIYPIELTATNYCGSHTTTSEVTVFPTPQVLFATDVDIFCSPYSVAFNNLTVGEPTSFLWEFGDGSTADTFNVPPHLYTTGDEPTDYTITLSATNDCGTDSQDYTITVLPNTVTAFFNTDITFGCAPLEVNFTNFSSGATEYYYSFGDAINSGSNEPSPTFTFTEPGIYTTQLFADNGCSYDTASVQIEVFETPLLTFTTEEDYCFGETVQFINTSPASDEFLWDFGDGNSSNETSPEHLYETAGSFEVTLTGQSLEDECPGFGQQTVVIIAAPEPSFEVPDQVGCSPFTVQFSNTTIGGDFYEWNFGDGNTAGIENPEHTFFNTTGESVLYPVTLTALNNNLCSSEYTFNIIVSPTPVADFVLSDYETCEDPFSVESANLSQYANNYQWTWPLGSSTVSAPTMEFTNSGIHEVELTASNSFGCTDTEVQQVTILPYPVASFEPAFAQSCPPLTTSLINFTTNADLYQWVFSNGDTSIFEEPTITFTEPGSYHATLIASNEFGCMDTMVYNNVVTVFPAPIAEFTFTPNPPTSQDLELEFINQSVGGYNYYWNFNNTHTSFLKNPTHVFPDGGSYTVQLMVENMYGCRDYVSHSVVIPQDFYIYVPNAFTPDHDGINEEFKPVVGGSNILNYTFQIFDRWGEKIFETNDRNAGWIGDVRGGDYYVKEEVYVWQVLVRYLSNGDVQKERIRGHVTVLR